MTYNEKNRNFPTISRNFVTFDILYIVQTVLQ